jgi:hypothetical protein
MRFTRWVNCLQQILNQYMLYHGYHAFSRAGKNGTVTRNCWNVQGETIWNALGRRNPPIRRNRSQEYEDTFFAEGIISGNDVLLSRPIRNVDFGVPAGGGRTLLKIHGSVSNPRPEGSIVITEEDYHRFLRQDRYIINKLYTLFCERTVVFLGYSLNDSNIQSIYHDVLFDQKAGDAGGDIYIVSRLTENSFRLGHHPHLILCAPVNVDD